MKKLIQIDANGYYVQDVIVEPEHELDSSLIDTPCPDGLYKPKFTNGAWSEGATQEEIDSIKNTPVAPSEIEDLRQQLANTNADFQALMDYLAETGVLA